VALSAADFAGTWHVARVIWHADGTVARFAGRAVWTAEGDAWRSIEAGWLGQDGAGFEARRETLWRDVPDGIAVAFGDGRPFHLWRLGEEARHHCPPDAYRLRYDLSAWPKWSVRWRVRGPRKDYAALTRYRRA
jgi:hypothetical protein